VVIDWPHTGERIRGRENYLAIQREYPGVWHCTIGHVVEGPGVVVADVWVDHADIPRCHCAGYYECRGGVVMRGTEYWTTLTAEEPPAWRARWAERT
jgi:hypothetical protein